MTATRVGGAHRLDPAGPAPSSDTGGYADAVDPYEPARAAVTAGGAGIRVVRVTGELSSSSASVLHDVLEHQIDARLAGLVVDLSAASFVGVRGIAAVVCAAERARRRGLALSVVVGEHAEITRVLSRTGRADGLLVPTSPTRPRARGPAAGPVADRPQCPDGPRRGA